MKQIEISDRTYWKLKEVADLIEISVGDIIENMVGDEYHIECHKHEIEEAERKNITRPFAYTGYLADDDYYTGTRGPWE